MKYKRALLSLSRMDRRTPSGVSDPRLLCGAAALHRTVRDACLRGLLQGGRPLHLGRDAAFQEPAVCLLSSRSWHQASHDRQGTYLSQRADSPRPIGPASGSGPWES